MPKLKQIDSLECLAIRSLVIYLTEIGEELIPILTKSLTTLAPQYSSYEIEDDDDDNAYVIPEDDGNVFDQDDDNEITSETKRRLKAKRDRRNSHHRRQASEILQSQINVLRTILEYNVPCFLYDRLCDGLFAEIPRMVDRIKSRKSIRTSMGEFLGQVNVAVSLAELVIGPYLTRCSFEEMPKMCSQVFFSRLACLTGMKYLNLGSLSGGWKTADMEPTLLAGLLKMRNLRYLSLNYDCTDNILLALIDSCPHLHTLDVGSSRAVNDDSVNLLMRIKSLRSIQLHKTSVTLEGYVKLLLKLPDLEDIGRYDDIGRCLEYIVDSYPEVKKFSLRRFSSRYVTTKFLQVLGEYCPYMQFVSIFYNALLCDLTALIGINQLSNLHLLACDFFSDQVRDVLAVKGCNITHLHLEHVDQIDMNALMYISQFCPDLQVFTIYNCELLESTSLYMKQPVMPPFMNLEHLTVIAQCDQEHLEFMMSSCLHIKTIKFGTMVPTTDYLFDRVLAKNPMECLEELSIVCSHGLTINTAYKLLDVCPNLTVLNELEGWARIQDFELEKFKNFVETNNFDLNIESKRFRTTTEELI